MKKLIYYLLIASIVISCDKINDPLEDILVIPEVLSAHTPEFDSQSSETKSSGLWEYQPEAWDGPSSVETRTYAVIDPENENEYIQYWSESDAISVFFTTANLNYQFIDFKEDGNGENEEDYGFFQLSSEAATGTELRTDYYYAVYPYKKATSINYKNGEVTYNFPKTQHYSKDSYSNAENGMIAYEPKTDTDGKWYFQNFCSYLQLRLITTKDKPKTVQQIILVANNSSDKMSGNASINMASGTVPKVAMKMTATNEVILDCGAGVSLSHDINDPTKFWFVLPGDFTFTDGFKITVTFDDNTYFEKSTTKTISILRSHIKPMATFTTIDEDGDDIVLTGPIRYKYKSTSTNEPYPIGGEFYGENGEKLQVINQVYDEATGEWVVYLSGKLKTIGGNNFASKKPNIEYIKIHEDTENPISIGDFAFYNSTADYIEIHNDVESIGKSALKGSTIQKIIIDGDVSVIREDAFTGCTKLNTFKATSIETIEKGAFQMCYNLTDVSLSGVKYLGASSFEDCISLTSINLDSIIKIEDAAFMGCYELTYVEISADCIMIGEGAFCNAEALETVICHAVYPPFIKTDNPDGSFVFDSTSEYICIYIPNDSINDYTDPSYFVNHNSGYTSPIQATVNWWYQEYTGKLGVMQN